MKIRIEQQIELENPIELYSDEITILVGLDAYGGIQIDVTSTLEDQVIFISKAGEIFGQYSFKNVFGKYR